MGMKTKETGQLSEASTTDGLTLVGVDKKIVV